MRVELEALDHVGLVVSDVSRSVRWYQEVLGLRRAHRTCGATSRPCWRPTAAGWPCSPTRTAGPSRSTTRCATSGSGPHAEAWRRPRSELAANGVEYEEGDYGVAWSVYLPDPDGYQVEITTYEPAPG